MKKLNDEKEFSQDNFVPFFKRSIFSFKNLNKILFAVLLVLGVSYVAGSNDLAIRGFALSDLKAQSNKLADENKKLELRAMTLSSYNAISGKIDNLKMVAVGTITYINGAKDTVAKK